MHERAVVVGASLAGLRAAESLRRAGHDGPLTIVGAEKHRPYDRPPLSKQILTGRATPEDISLHVSDDLGADWILGRRAAALDLSARRVRLDDREEIPFDGLVIATGSKPRLLRGSEHRRGVHYLRTVDDATALRDELASARKLVVIGAGFIGLEVAASARKLGLDVTVVEALPVPLAQAIGPEMGSVIADLQRRNGVDLRVGTGVEGFEGSDRVEAVRLADGTVVDADVVVVGIGVTPAVEWLEGSGVDLSDGVLCDERMRVNAGGVTRPDVVAAGDVARWAHPAYGASVRVEHWTNASEQGDAAGVSLILGNEAPVYSPTPYFWSDQHGVKIQFVGSAQEGDAVEVIEGEPSEDKFVAAYGRNGCLVAALGIRRPARVMALQQMISAGASFPPPPPD